MHRVQGYAKVLSELRARDDDVFYLFLQKQKIGAELHIYLEEGTYHKRLFRGPTWHAPGHTHVLAKSIAPTLSLSQLAAVFACLGVESGLQTR